MIAIETAFQSNAERARAQFLEASAVQQAQIVTLGTNADRTDIAIVANAANVHIMAQNFGARKGLVLVARTLEEAALLTFALHDEGWREKYSASALSYIIYVLHLGKDVLPFAALHNALGGVEFIEVNIAEATKNYASHGEFISLARRALFAAADAA